MKLIHSKHIGMGGIKCPCCSKGETVKEKRIKLNRHDRRKNKQILIKKEDI